MTRQALGSAAMRLAVDRGLDNVLVDDIVEAAGVSARRHGGISNRHCRSSKRSCVIIGN
jgi:hypothetical protein